MASSSKKELGISDWREFPVGGQGQLHQTSNFFVESADLKTVLKA